MHAQHSLKRGLKPLVLPDRRAPRKVLGGPGRGIVALLNPQDDLQRQWGLHESELNDIYRDHISSDGVVYDIGAGDGLTTLLYANLARFGCVLAFEPDREALGLLHRNIALNPRLAQAIVVVPEAFGDRLDPSWPFPTFVKVDVDGAELLVLDALAALVAHRPPIVVETHSADLERDSIARLDGLGYRTRIIPNARWRALWPEWRPIEHNRWVLALP